MSGPPPLAARAGNITAPASRLLPLTRAVFAAGVFLTAGAGLALYAAPDRTEDFWAWTIAAPLTAAFLGAGYLGAALALVLALRAREWQRARIVAVVAATLTSLALVATVLHPAPFAFGEGGAGELAAWIWVAVYAALPPGLAVAFVRQERRGGSREYVVGQPALAASRLAFGVVGALLGALGLGLLGGSELLADRWPWPLPALPAGVVGAWLCTFAAGWLWFALRDPDWRRFRIAVLPAALTVTLNLAAAARYSGTFDGGDARTAYAVGLGVLLAVLASATLAEERRLERY